MSNRRVGEDTVEAILGAVVLDADEQVATRLIRAWLPSELPAWKDGDPIVQLMEWFQKRRGGVPPEPEYASAGEDHERTWTAWLQVGDWIGVGSGVGKKGAKREACQSLLVQIGGDV